ncbi:beta-soluble NSF attachment protein [Cyclospora cayetanensis]|uniref:Snap protein (Soluble n-ethylmaleimide-sensitive factor attachment protein) n=2 Tax=Cyclospora cayetanensis TaxID=88456 RepID=A0A1D3CSD4_9EIME|nr:beta-soluble NSF attachment protein [Cyclospora cayetanensis]OEH74108.1 snap protein (soluble n-ethylmaleimide-sensitive factor attachment protein) [Cyclospora cayetanensis]
MEGVSASVDLSEIPQLMRQAEQAMKPPGLLGQIFGREADYDTAVQLLQQCAQKYKLARVFPEAASCYIKAAEAANKAKDTHTEATLYVEAGNCMRRYSLADSVPVFSKGISVLLASGRLAAAGKIHRQLAEEYEATGDRPAAAIHYLKASELFETDEFSKTQYSHCICKYAELLAWGGDDPSKPQNLQQTAQTLETAAKIFETEGYKVSQNNLLQYGAKDLFLKALLLRLSIPRYDPGDFVDLQLALGRYGERNPHFATSREAQLLKQLIAASEERDSDAFAAAVEAFDSITRLDPWKVHFLLKAKSLLGGDGVTAQGAPVQLGEDGEIDLS